MKTLEDLSPQFRRYLQKNIIPPDSPDHESPTDETLYIEDSRLLLRDLLSVLFSFPQGLLDNPEYPDIDENGLIDDLITLAGIIKTHSDTGSLVSGEDLYRGLAAITKLSLDYLSIHEDSESAKEKVKSLYGNYLSTGEIDLESNDNLNSDAFLGQPGVTLNRVDWLTNALNGFTFGMRSYFLSLDDSQQDTLLKERSTFISTLFFDNYQKLTLISGSSDKSPLSYVFQPVFFSVNTKSISNLMDDYEFKNGWTLIAGFIAGFSESTAGETVNIDSAHDALRNFISHKETPEYFSQAELAIYRYFNEKQRDTDVNLKDNGKNISQFTI